MYLFILIKFINSKAKNLLWCESPIILTILLSVYTFLWTNLCIIEYNFGVFLILLGIYRIKIDNSETDTAVSSADHVDDDFSN